MCDESTCGVCFVCLCVVVGIVELCVCEELFVQCMHLLLFLLFLLMMMRCFDCFVVALFHTVTECERKKERKREAKKGKEEG